MIMMSKTAMMMKKNGVCHIDRHPSIQQPCGGHCPVVLQIVWYTHAKRPSRTVSEAPRITTATLDLAFVVLRGNYYTTEEGD
jgi:hypothetical protein